MLNCKVSIAKILSYWVGQHGITYDMPSYALFRNTCDSLTECGRLSQNIQTFDSLKQICYIITVEIPPIPGKHSAAQFYKNKYHGIKMKLQACL